MDLTKPKTKQTLSEILTKEITKISKQNSEIKSGLIQISNLSKSIISDQLENQKTFLGKFHFYQQKGLELTELCDFPIYEQTPQISEIIIEQNKKENELTIITQVQNYLVQLRLNYQNSTSNPITELVYLQK